MVASVPKKMVGVYHTIHLQPLQGYFLIWRRAASVPKKNWECTIQFITTFARLLFDLVEGCLCAKKIVEVYHRIHLQPLQSYFLIWWRGVVRCNLDKPILGALLVEKAGIVIPKKLWTLTSFLASLLVTS